jgi:hypothetical protein
LIKNIPKVKPHDYKWSKKVATSFGLDVWNPPENLSITTTSNKL